MLCSLYCCSLQCIMPTCCHADALLPPCSFYPPTGEASQKLIVNSTQPLLEYNGFIRWALNNVAHTKNPTCEVGGSQGPGT